MSVEVPTYDEWCSSAEKCDECVNPLSVRAKLCWKHKIEYWQLTGTSGVGNKSHTHRVGEQPIRRPEQNNAWERGIARDDRGVRILNSAGNPIRMKEYTQHRHHIDAEVKKLRA